MLPQRALGKTVRTIQNLLRDYNEKGISAITVTERSDKGEYRMPPTMARVHC